MSLLVTSYARPRTPGILARIGAWLAHRPTTRQRQATIDLEAASDNLKRDLGLELIIHSERRW